ncbi:MAG TPA: GNAT family N-acetyltransferase [Acidimicrobiia bacterium]
MIVREAVESDTGRLAELHAGRITDGFLPTLGPAFLDRLYRRIVRSADSFAFVAAEEDDGAQVLGFAAATADLGALYKTFAWRDGVIAGFLAAPRLLRSWRRVVETVRYPASEGADLPAAEILAVAVDERAGGRGIGTRVVDAATQRLAAHGARAVKVVTGSDNDVALRLYAHCGFEVRTRVEVHEGVSSEVLVWNSSSR